MEEIGIFLVDEMARVTNPAEAITQIEHRRQALQRLVVIAHSLEQLNRGLQSTLLMGRPAGAVPKSALTAFAQLDEKTSILPDAKLKHTVGLLEASIKSRVSRIIEAVLLDDGQLSETLPGGGSAPAMPDMLKMLGEFRKNAQTAVALKVLLKKRGVPTRPMEFAIPEDEIRRHINALKAKETRYRGQMEKNIEGMVEDTRHILAMEGLNDEMREAAQHVLHDLEANLAHLKAGKSIESLPMALEVIEVGDDGVVEERAEPEVEEVESPPEPEAKPAPESHQSTQSPQTFSLWEACRSFYKPILLTLGRLLRRSGR